MPADSQKKFAEIFSLLSAENESLPVLLHDGTEREIPVRLIVTNNRIITAGRKRRKEAYP
jgi:hypothetical protein